MNIDGNVCHQFDMGFYAMVTLENYSFRNMTTLCEPAFVLLLTFFSPLEKVLWAVFAGVVEGQGAGDSCVGNMRR